MMQNITLEGTICQRVINTFRVLTRNPDTQEDHEDMAAMVIQEAVTVMENHAFATVDRVAFQVLHLGQIAIDSSVQDAAHGHYRKGYTAETMHSLRGQIERGINYLIDIVLEQFPFITLVKADGSYEREVSDEARITGFKLLKQGATVEHKTQAAVIQTDPRLLESLPPGIREQYLQREAGAAAASAPQNPAFPVTGTHQPQITPISTDVTPAAAAVGAQENSN